MERDGIPHAPLATDQEFFRRVTLDLTGRIPHHADLREFLADTSPDKRARLIDRLIGSPAFVDKWSYFYMDLLRANGKMGRGVQLFHYMLKESLASDRPYDDFVALPHRRFGQEQPRRGFGQSDRPRACRGQARAGGARR